MSKLTEIWAKICRNWTKIRLQPIHVYCLHHVCAVFDADSMIAVDWMQIDEFKKKVQNMQREGVEFISLTEAYKHISSDWIRSRKLAVLTFDDGYASLKEILPWLEEQHIPVTLFINGKYLDGKSYRKNPKENYLTKDEVFALTSPLIEIGSHGWEHLDATKMTMEEFAVSEIKNHQILCAHLRYVPYYAYTYGRHNDKHDQYLRTRKRVPVLIDKADNYQDQQFIHRRLL